MLIVTKEEKIVGQCKSSVSKELEYLKTIGDIHIKDGLTVRDLYGGEYYAIKELLEKLDDIRNANPSEAMECLKRIYSEYLLPEYCGTSIMNEIDDLLNTIKQALLKEQENEELKVDICEMFGLDNLFPYNDTKAILKELEEYMGRKNQLWLDFMKTSKKLKEQEKVLKIIKGKVIWVENDKLMCGRYADIEIELEEEDFENKEEFDTLKEWMK